MVMAGRPCAHSPNPLGEWHLLADHLRGAAERTRAFAGAFGAGELGYWLGLWHDLGKYNPEWQQYLQDSHYRRRKRGSGPDHKAAGAKLAADRVGPAAALIQGHHGGLPKVSELRGWLADRGREVDIPGILERARADLPDLEPAGEIALPDWVNQPHAAELFMRLVFSALIDADRLDTEAHAVAPAVPPRGPHISMAGLWQRFAAAQEALAAAPDTPVNQARREIYAACLVAAEQPQGVFRLRVPTGGGKTRAGMAFALRHALAYGLQRVIVAVPFITITEQTAQVYRDIFQDTESDAPVVLEHHSGAAEANDEAFGDKAEWARLAAENWDAPVIVTTTVQLFESLFAARTSAIRKAHRLAKSVIILDEAQALPVHLLRPVLSALADLCRYAGATVVLSTATQPAFDVIEEFRAIEAREIVPEPARYFQRLRRVTYDWRTDRTMTWEEIATLLRGEAAALAVLNTKQNALDLLTVLDDPEALHLSTMLCGAHRRAVITEIRRRLSAGLPCRVVATQVVEAGVDFDFPLVVRALGPLDAVIQAAGRCNREGLLPEGGRVIVVEPVAGGSPPGPYRTATGVARTVLTDRPVEVDDPATVDAYYRQYFQLLRGGTDRERIQELRAKFDFPEVARRFRMIDQDTVNVVITSYGTPQEQEMVRLLLQELPEGGPGGRALLRRLQPYLVSLPRNKAAGYQRDGLIATVIDGLGEWRGPYDPVRGLTAADTDLVS